MVESNEIFRNFRLSKVINKSRAKKLLKIAVQAQCEMSENQMSRTATSLFMTALSQIQLSIGQHRVKFSCL